MEQQDTEAGYKTNFPIGEFFYRVQILIKTSMQAIETVLGEHYQFKKRD